MSTSLPYSLMTAAIARPISAQSLIVVAHDGNRYDLCTGIQLIDKRQLHFERVLVPYGPLCLR